MDYNKYEYDESCVFPKQILKERLEKQLGDFGEQLVMTMLGRIAQYSVAYVDHEGADLIASDKKGKSYAISVKSNQIGPTENETKVFKFGDQKKLCAFAKDFDLIPAVAMIFIPKDFAFIDLYLLTLKSFYEIAKDESNSAIKIVKKGLQINNYALGMGKKPKYSDGKGYLHFLHNHALIEHVRLDIQNRKNFVNGIKCCSEDEDSIIEKLLLGNKKYKDENLKRQLGDFGEYFLQMLIGQLKNYKIARVDHVGADLIATDKQHNRYAISVKTISTGSYKFKELYVSTEEPNPQKELSKLQDFADKYKNMVPVIALVFIKPDFQGIDIYISKMSTWLELAFYENYGKAIQYKTYCYEEISLEQWKENLVSLDINSRSKKNKKIILNNIKEIEHMEILFSNLLQPNKEW